MAAFELGGRQGKRLCVLVEEKQMSKWFCLNLGDDVGEGEREGEGEGEIKIPVDLGTMPSGRVTFAVAVAMDSIIYVLARNCNWRGSYSSEQKGFVWGKVAHMRNRLRVQPAASAVADKIYVFGGMGMEVRPGPFGEVYDPNSDKWEALPEPPEGARGHVSLHAVDSSKQRILLSIGMTSNRGASPLFAFYVENRSWSCIDDNFGVRWSGPAVVAADELLLCTDPGNLTDICAYNLGLGKWLPQPFCKVQPGFCCDFLDKPSLLIDLGNGKLCYVLRKLIYEKYARTELKVLADCTEFSVYRTPQGDWTLVMEPTSREFALTKFSSSSGFIYIWHDHVVL